MPRRACRSTGAPIATMIIVSLIALATGQPARAATATVTFDDLPAGTSVSAQYAGPAGISFAGPVPGDGWLPVVRVAPGLARSGDRVADIATCTASNCEGFLPRSVGRLSTLATKVSLAPGYLGTDLPAPTALITLRALSALGTPLDTASTTVTQGQPFSQTLTVATATPQIAAFEVTGPTYTGGIAIDDLALTTPDAPQPPDFGLVVSADPVSVPEQDAVDVPVNVSRLNGSNGDVALTASDLPAGLTASFTPNPLPAGQTQATMRFTAQPGAPTTAEYTTMTITAAPGPGAGSAPRTATKLVRVVGNCVKSVRADFLDARTSGCMRSQGPDIVVANDQPVRLNGLLLEPQDSPSRIIINTRERTVSSDGADVRVSPADHPRIKLHSGEIDWNLGGTSDRPRQVIDDDSLLRVSAGGEEPLVDVFLFFRVERVTVSLTREGRAQVLPTLAFGFWPFNYLGKRTALTTGFSTDNDRGSNLDGFGFGIDDVTALGLGLKKVSLLYQAGGTLQGGATVVLRLGRPYEVQAAFGLRRGAFDYLNGSVSGINTPVSPGVFLQRIGFGVSTDPFALRGTVAFSAGPQVLGVQPITVNGSFSAVFADPWVVELDGTANLVQKYFGDRFQLGRAYLRYSSTGLFAFGGVADWDLGVAYAKGGVTGFVDGLDAFDVEGSVRACIRIPLAPDPCAGAALLASNLGLAACLDAAVLRAGVGYAWGGDFDLLWGSCDLSRWRPVASSAVAAAPARERRVSVPRGLRRFALAVDGVGTAPDVRLTGPGGQSIEVSAAQPRVNRGALSALRGEGTTSYLAVTRPPAGTWTITATGAEPIARVRRAIGLPEPSVRASVAGRGRDRVLRWRLRPVAGQRVRLVEIGRDVRRVLATTRAPAGGVRFRPADGPAGRRRIVALVEQDGRLRARLAAGAYLAPGPERPARPSDVRLTRRRGGLVVSWRSSTPRFRHGVALQVADGRALVKLAPAGASSVRIPGVAVAYGARAAVLGLTAANGKGPASGARIAGAVAPPAAGRWRLSPVFGFVRAGRFTVAAGSRVRKLRVEPGPRADPACGTAALTLAAAPRLVRGSDAGRALLAVGRPERPARVTLRQGGRRRAAMLELRFIAARRATGELRFGSCRLHFEAAR